MNIEIIRKEVEIYKDQLQRMNGRSERSTQADSILKVLEQHLQTEGPINIIETGASHKWDDGMMGLLFARISQHTGGKMWMVDIDDSKLNTVRNYFNRCCLWNCFCFCFIRHA